MHFQDPFMKANTLIFILNAKFPLKKEKHSCADFSQQPLLRGVMSHDLPNPQGSHLQTLYILFNNIWIFYMILVIFECENLVVRVQIYSVSKKMKTVQIQFTMKQKVVSGDVRSFDKSLFFSSAIFSS